MKLTAENIQRLIAEGGSLMDAASETKLPDEDTANRLVAIALATAATLIGREATADQVFACVLAVRTAFLLGRESRGWG